jgi:hypothetical protein
MSIKYNKRPKNGPSVHKIYQHLPLQDPPKFTQIWIFGLKTNHLATLLQSVFWNSKNSSAKCNFIFAGQNQTQSKSDQSIRN